MLSSVAACWLGGVYTGVCSGVATVTPSTVPMVLPAR